LHLAQLPWLGYVVGLEVGESVVFWLDMNGNSRRRRALSCAPLVRYWPGLQASVGKAVGLAVGDAVGKAVGKAVGDAAGLAAGYAVGLTVGDAVG